MSEDKRIQILVAAVGQIERSGEASVRLRDIAREVGISEPSIYHYFANREQLIVSAHAHRFEVNLLQTLTPFIDALVECTSADDFIEILIRLYRSSFPDARVVARATRAEIVGASNLRPLLREEIAATTKRLFAPAIELLRNAQAQGWLRASIDIDAFAYWNLAMITGLVFAELLADEEVVVQYREFLLESVELTIRGPQGGPG